MNMLQKVGSFLFGYDATDSQNRRRVSPTPMQWSEDRVLNRHKRKQMQATSRDLMRNMSIASWAVNKHLDYVSTFSFQSRMPDPEFNRRFEELVTWWSRPYNCDTTGRFSFPQLIRMMEQRRTIDGDVFILKNTDGRIQIIESDRVRSPEGYSAGMSGEYADSQVVQGVQLGRTGRHQRYAVSNRSGTGYQFDRWYPSSRIEHLGYFNRYDQVRGISPLAPAINTFTDLYECYSYALAKAKLSQILGIAITRESFGEESDPIEYEIDFATTGVKTLNMEPGDAAEILESKNPSNEFQSFTEQMTMAALKALDLPMILYNEAWTNYSGARSALLQYESSSESKRLSLTSTLDRLVAWRASMWIRDGLLELPRGMSVSDLRWEWVSRGVPWVDPLKEIKADIAAINAGLLSRQQVSKRYGREWTDTVKQLAQEEALIAELGVTLSESEMVGVEPEPEPEQSDGIVDRDTANPSV